MKVKLKTLMAGPGGCFQPGETIDVKEAEARALVSGGFAEAVGKWPKKEPPKEPDKAPGETGTEE